MTPLQQNRPAGRTRPAIRIASALLVLAALAAYANSVQGPFVYDDLPAIVANSSLRDLGDWARVVSPPAGNTASGRPLLNMSLALNYAAGGLAVTGYHVVNVVIHILAGLILFGLVRRVFLQPVWRGRFDRSSLPLAAAAAGIWLLHPVQTEAVDYVVQRAESLMSLFLLLTCYGFIRAVQSGRPRRWLWVSIVSCASGMATKENMVAAPLLVLLLDRAVVASSVARAWRERWRYYIGLGATWVVLVLLLATTGGNRGGSVGFGTGVHPWSYWLTQFPALVRYIDLAFWPHPLVFDYGTFWVDRLVDIIPQVIVVMALVGATVVALRRHPALGFCGACFFAILAPTSIMPGTTQMIVEHRLYLPLAALVVPLAWGIWELIGGRCWPVLALAAGALALLTGQRNAIYRHETTLWGTTVAQRPLNAKAQYNFGNALIRAGRPGDAMIHYQSALAAKPDYAEADNNLGNVLRDLGRPAEARPHYEEALRLAPQSAETHANLGNTLVQLGRPAEAVACFESALKLRPDFPEAHANLGDALAQLGRGPEAMAQYKAALALDSRLADAQRGLADALFAAGQLKEAIDGYRATLALTPDDDAVRLNCGEALFRAGRAQEALPHFERVIGHEPNLPAAHYEYGNALLEMGNAAAAVAQFREAIRLRPDYVEAHYTYAHALVLTGHPDEAAAELRQALALRPTFAPAREALDRIQAGMIRH